MGEFPWTCDQYQRYSVLEEVLKVFFGEKRAAVLDVGGLSPDREGRTQWLPLQKIRKENGFVADLQYCGQKGFVQADGLNLPFKTEAFDTVSSLDVIEHIPAEQRESFIEELARVSRSAVVLSAPFKDRRLELAEMILFEQVEALYGTEHRQLLEHKKYILPEVETIESVFSRHFPFWTGFSYGSLQNWLFFQSLKNLYLGRRRTPGILSQIDRWMVSCGQEAEFTPPFSRHFWIGAKNVPQEELEQGAAVIRDNLRARTEEKPNIEELGAWIQEITCLQTIRNVSALVFIFGDGETTEECLRHLLTQKADFELEVTTVDLSPGQAAGRVVRERFPMVRIFSPEKGEGLSSLVSRVAAGLMGEYFLWISDGILLPGDSAEKLHRRQKESPSPSILIPWIDREGEDFFFCGKGSPSSGDRRRLQRVSEGRFEKKSSDSDFQTEKAGWAYSECFFFPRQALFERIFSKQELTRENVFLWPSVRPAGSFLRCPEILVHKKRTHKGSK